MLTHHVGVGSKVGFMPVPDLELKKLNNFGSIPIDLAGSWLEAFLTLIPTQT